MRFRLIILFLIFGLGLSAQEDEETAAERLHNLKNGMLLVRLQTASKQIEALKERGLDAEAEQIQEKQYEENKEAILAFSQVFDFCPVYFFYANQSEEIRKQQLSGNIFNNNLEVIEDASSLPSYFLTGEFAETPQLKIDGFVIMDRQMLPLEAPFPFYQKEHTFLIFSLSKGQMIERLNTKLHDKYEFRKP